MVTLENIKRVLDELPSQRRQAFLLCRLEGLSIPEIAELMGIEERTVRTHIVEAVEHFVKRINWSAAGRPLSVV